MKNGINLDKSIHKGFGLGHSTYNKNLKNYIDNNISFINTADEAKAFLSNLQTKIRNQFDAGKKLDEIIFD